MTAVALIESGRRWDFCPEARADTIMVKGRCQFCFGDHKLFSKLSPDQRKAVRMLAAGSTPQQIAAQLGAKYNTIHHRFREARLIVGAKTTEHLVAILAREGSV